MGEEFVTDPSTVQMLFREIDHLASAESGDEGETQLKRRRKKEPEEP